MDKYIEVTEKYLNIIQTSLSKEEFKRSEKAAHRLYDLIQKVSEEEQLLIREMLNAVLAVNLTILKVCQEQIQQYKALEDKANE